MDRIMVAVAIGMVLVFGVGVTLGVVAMLSMAIRREDTKKTLTGQAPGLLTRGARRLNGVGLRDITPRGAEWPP